MPVQFQILEPQICFIRDIAPVARRIRSGSPKRPDSPRREGRQFAGSAADQILPEGRAGSRRPAGAVFRYLANRQANSTTAAPAAAADRRDQSAAKPKQDRNVIADERAGYTHQRTRDDTAGRSGELAGKPRRAGEPVKQNASDDADNENQNKRHNRVGGAHGMALSVARTARVAAWRAYDNPAAR
jgi:hypothetical protein